MAVDTAAARVVASFSAGRSSPRGQANGGMWGAGGPAVGDDGTVFMTTGNGPPQYGPSDVAGTWSDSLLAWDAGLALAGTYSPWNYCLSDANGVPNLGGNPPQLLPDSSGRGTSTPSLVAFGSKQGTVYLLERDALPGSVTARAHCDPGEDCRAPPMIRCCLAAPGGSALLPDPAAPASCVAGPLSVFGPYSDAAHANEDDSAKMRSAPAFFGDSSGTSFLFVAGSSKAADGSTSMAPSLARPPARERPCGYARVPERRRRQRGRRADRPGSPS